MNEFWKHNPRKRQNGANSGLADALFGDLDAPRLLTRESPKNRLICELVSTGMSNNEAARAAGVTSRTVSNTVRQPWARERIIENMNNASQDELKKMFEGEAVPSFKKIVEIRDSPMSNPDTALKAANNILDRILGKPTQPVEQRTQQLEAMSDAELQRIALGDPACTGNGDPACGGPGNGTNS